MAHHIEKGTDDLIIDGFQNGIASSPHAGLADIKNININSLPGEAAVNYARINALPVVSGGTMSASGANNTLNYTPSGANVALVLGSAVLVSSSTITNFTSSTGGGPNSNWFWVANIPSPGTYQFAKTYNGAIISNFGLTGTATFSTVPFSKFIQGTDEFVQSQNAFRYYLVDTNSQVWVNDPNVYGIFSPSGSNAVSSNTNCQGFGVSQGVVTVFVENQAVQKFTNRIGDDSFIWSGYGFYLNTPVGSSASHKAIRSQVANGALLYPDSQFVGSIQGANDQFSLIRGTTPGGGSDITVSSVEQGVLPAFETPNIIVGAYAPQGGSLPVELDPNTAYYIVEVASNGGTFRLSATNNGSPITISSGSYYITTFDPAVSSTVTTHRQALALPYSEQATTLAEISLGNVVNLVVGGITASIYFWDESSSGYTTVRLPEANTAKIINVSNVAYVFAGNKGNIYLTNASGVGGVMTVPDYVANVNGGNQDPYFIWGDGMFLRGRVWFSIQDQTSAHTGNCGGVWSFTPPETAALNPTLDGTGLHLENENSYGTFNGVCNVLLPSNNQQAKGPQYWTAWTSSSTSPTYGIDFSDTAPYSGGQAYIDTDIVAIGTSIDKGTPVNIEFKLARPLVSGESVQVLARPDLTSAFSLFGVGQNGGSGIVTTVGVLSDLFKSNVQNLQWIQLRIILTSTATTPSFVPLTEIRLRIGK